MTESIVRIARIALVVAAITMAIMVHAPWLALAGVGLIGASVLAQCMVYQDEFPRLAKTVPWIAYISTVLIVLSLAFGKPAIFTFNSFFALQAWLIAVAVFPSPSSAKGFALTLWTILGFGWSLLGTLIFVAENYVDNTVGLFYLGLATVLGQLIAIKWRLRPPTLAVQSINTVILLIVGLPIVDAFTRPHYDVQSHPDELKRYYSYSVAKKDPEAFSRWSDYCREQWSRFEDAVIIREPTNFPPFRLRPHSHARMFKCDYVINSIGFRGPEISANKGNAFRIVAIGESTTFGISLTPDHHPWPQVLEGIIRDRLRSERPVEVINAGVPGATLPENIYRLQHQILALQPDMIISYHGYNGFPLLDSAIPPARGQPPPIYQPRPVKLLANFEYARKMSRYKRKLTAQLFFHTPTFLNPLGTRYAAAYRELIEIARKNHLRLVIANYSMAVTLQSDPAVIEFYRRGWPVVQTQIRANVAHSQIVQELAASEPSICFVDTHPNLDGQSEKFIDLVHFDPEGERQMAETFFAKIRPLLEQALTQPKAK